MDPYTLGRAMGSALKMSVTAETLKAAVDRLTILAEETKEPQTFNHEGAWITIHPRQERK